MGHFACTVELPIARRQPLRFWRTAARFRFGGPADFIKNW
jgi:hypothetical protein